MTSIVATRDGAVVTLRFNRPEKRNALDAEMLDRLSHELERAHEDDDTRVVILTGSNGVFSTGADLNSYRGYDRFAVRRANLTTWMRVFDLIEAIDVPVIAAVQGYAVAGGTELTLACDIVIAADDAKLGLTEMRVGVIPGAGACVRLPRWIGRAGAKELLMTGDIVTAQEAHRIGLVNRLVAPDELEAAAAGFARELADRSPLALAAVKRAVNIGSEMEQHQGISYVLMEFASLFGTRDQEEGMTAFLEKRAPRFTGS